MPTGMLGDIRRAKLVKRATEDGLFELHGHLKIGIEYEVDISTIQMANGYNTVMDMNWIKEIIYMTDGQWMPTELLEWEKEK